ncbi:MAG: hypothetical protein HYR60_08410 [Acidobacteria bacterium]|nr:hypothetical protein [Acidobacteriota bacterium]
MLTASQLGLEIQNQAPLGPGMGLAGITPGTADETYTVPHGKTNPVRNHYNSILTEVVEGEQRHPPVPGVVAGSGGLKIWPRPTEV